MRVWKNGVTGEGEIYLEPDESEIMKEIIRGHGWIMHDASTKY